LTKADLRARWSDGNAIDQHARFTFSKLTDHAAADKARFCCHMAGMSASNTPREITCAELADQLRALGVKQGGVLLVHTSFRAVRPIEGGPRGLIDALRKALGPAGTLVMPSWTEDDDNPFDPKSTPSASDLGIVAQTFWRLPGVARSDHPFACAAIGPRADFITSDPLPIPPHIPESPVGRVHDLDGQVLLLGVGHDQNTTIHLAEILGGAPYRLPKHITVVEDGRPVRIDYGENDICGQRFALMHDWLREKNLQAEGKVGNAHARLMRARDIVSVGREHLQRDPLIFLHPAEANCEECDLARKSVAEKL
jgi:aminoglycoside N3'-acetyltransferase